MLMIRLQRTGKKNQPSFRLVLTDSRNATRSGKFLEVLGNYDVLKGKKALKEDRIKYWLSQGAQPSGTVHNMLVDAKIVEGKKIHVSPNPKKEATSAAAEAAAAPVTETPAAA